MTNEEKVINGIGFEETVSDFELLFDEFHNKEFCTMTRIRDYAEYYKEENTKLKAEIEQLKSELGQSVKEKSEVISKIEYALNECEPIYNKCAFIPQAKPIYNLAMNYCLDLLKGQV